jgi:putative isomerase
MVENYVAWDMMMKYGHQAEAEDLAQRVLNLVNRDIAETGTLHEYYSPETGKPLNNAGLLSWNPLVTLF